MRRDILRQLGAVSLLLLPIGACQSSDEPAKTDSAESAFATADGLVDASITLNHWGSGYCANGTITNKGSTATTSWTVTVNLNGTVINNQWNVTGTSTGGVLTASGLGSTAVVSPNGSATFGFCGNGAGRPEIAGVTQSGSTGTPGAGGSSSGAGGSSAKGGSSSSAGGSSAKGGSSAAGGTSSQGSTGNTPTGSITREVWNNVTGTAVSAIPLSNAPSQTSTLTSFEAPSNTADNYGQRLRGYIVAPATGNYTFWISGDDSVELWLGTSAEPSTKRRIGYHNGYTNAREWNKYTTQKSAAINLTAGVRYYVEALMKEGTGGDNLAVGWLKPNQTGNVPTEVVPGSVLAPYSSNGGNNGTGGTSGAGGTSSVGGSSARGGSSATGGTSNNGGGVTVTPVGSDGKSGYATRYWDCCKPHCAWPGRATGTMKMCSIGNSLLSDANAKSSCDGGGAYTCWNMAPWKVSDTVAYGYAATPGGGNDCGKCYQLDFTGAGHYSGSDPGSQTLRGKTIIVQSTNVGYDVAGGQFDLLIPGGGVGAFDGCSKQWGTTDLGAQYGGFLTACGGDYASKKSCVLSKCQQVFAGKADLLAGCQFFVEWMGAADNPNVRYKQVACPAELIQKSGIQ